MAFEKIGVRAVIEGLSIFNRDARLINKRLKEVTGNIQELEKTSKGLNATLTKFSPQLKKAGLALTALGAAGGFFLFKATQLAARVETLGVVTEVLGKNVGKTKDEIRGLEQAVADQGITMRVARTSIALMIQSNIDLSNAVDLAAEAQNAAVIAGVDSSEAFRRLVFTITSGNVRMARTLGLQVSFQEAYEKTAASLGKTTLELTQQEKVQARTAEVLKAGTRIVGAYDAAMDTAGKKVTSLNRHIEESTRIMGELFLPLFADAVDLLTEFLEGIEEATVAQQRGIAATLAATTAVAGLSGVSLLFLSQLPSLIAGLKLLGVTLTASTGIIGLIIAAFVAMGVAAIKASAENTVLKESFKDLAVVVSEENESFKEYEKRVFEAAEGTTLWSNALRLSERTSLSFNEALRLLLTEQGLFNEEQFKAQRAITQTDIAQEALIGSLRGVGTALADQISDIRLSEISYRDYVEQVEDLAEANDVSTITTKDFIDAVNRGVSPVALLSKNVLVASERQFDLAVAAEESDRRLLRFHDTAGDAKSATAELAEKLGITEEELLKVAEAAGIVVEGLDKIPEDVEIKIQAELDKGAQERIQSELSDLQFTIDTRLSVDFEGFQTELEEAEDALAELEIENIEAIADIRSEGTKSLEDQADRIDDLNDRRGDEIFRLKELELRLEKARAKLSEMSDETSELDRRSQELQIEGLLGDLSGQKESIGELTSEIAELRGGTEEMVSATDQALSEQEQIYQDKLQGRVKDIDAVTEAWSRQTKEIIFNLATQRFGIDGFTEEELDALIRLAGPGGLGLIDEAAVSLLEFMDKVNVALAEPGNAAPIVVDAMSDMADSMIDPKQNAEEVAAAFREIGAATLELASDPLFQRFSGFAGGTLGLENLFPTRQHGGPVQRGQAYRVGEAGEELFVPGQSGIVVPSALTKALTGLVTSATSAIPVAGAAATATAAAGGTTTQNFNMSIHTQAQAEQIAADFNLMALMGERRA